MAQHTFDAVLFRAQCAGFADETKYPDELLSGYFDIARCYISEWDNPVLNGKCLQLALNLVTAQIAYINAQIANGTYAPGTVTGTSVGSVSVSFTTPPSKGNWQYWLNLTPYGQQLLALLKMVSAGGFIFNGRPEQSSFRKVGGRW